MEELTLLYVTAKDLDEARRLGGTLIEERLAACVNILPGMQSIYRWEDKIEYASETVLIVKTSRRQAESATRRLQSLHSYENPCILEIPVQGGAATYLHWLRGEII